MTVKYIEHSLEGEPCRRGPPHSVSKYFGIWHIIGNTFVSTLSKRNVRYVQWQPYCNGNLICMKATIPLSLTSSKPSRSTNFKVLDVTTSTTTIAWTPLFVWVECRSKNEHQDDMCSKEIGPRGQNTMNIILGSAMNVFERGGGDYVIA
jgi:hypothetical protein